MKENKMKENKNKVWVHYVIGCSPRLKGFKTLAAANRFISHFVTNEDNWIDFVFTGKFVMKSDYYSQRGVVK